MTSHGFQWPTSRTLGGSYHCCGEKYKDQDVRTTRKYVPEGTKKEQPSSISRLQQCRYGGGPLEADIESFGDLEQDWLDVVEVCDCECSGLNIS